MPFGTLRIAKPLATIVNVKIFEKQKKYSVYHNVNDWNRNCDVQI